MWQAWSRFFYKSFGTDHCQYKMREIENPSGELPADTHILLSGMESDINEALLHGFLKHQQDGDVKRTHLFNGRYENIYLTPGHIPQIRDLLDEACSLASSILGIDDLQAGSWFNYMPPGAVTTLHSHDDDDELLSAVYYVSVPDHSGNLIIHDNDRQHVIAPQQGLYVFFAPDTMHEVSENMSQQDRLSIGINFGRRDIGR